MTLQQNQKSAEQRYEDERAFHNEAFGEGTRAAASKYYSIIESSRKFYNQFLVSRCNGKQVLEYGCGPGSAAFMLAENGAFVTGIDISDVAIRQAEEETAKRGLKGTYIRMNAEEMTFQPRSFDLICGTGILHHLDLKKAFAEIARVMRPEGHAIFVEPLGHNPIINLYRNLTPAMRTEDEHPFLMADLRLAESYFEKVEVRYYHLASLAAVPFRSTGAFTSLVNAMDSVDQGIFKLLPWVQRYAWMAVIAMSQPKTPPAANGH